MKLLDSSTWNNQCCDTDVPGRTYDGFNDWLHAFSGVVAETERLSFPGTKLLPRSLKNYGVYFCTKPSLVHRLAETYAARLWAMLRLAVAQDRRYCPSERKRKRLFIDPVGVHVCMCSTHLARNCG